MDTEDTCVMCGEAALHLVEATQAVKIEGIELQVPYHTHVCATCGSTQALNEDLRFNARAMRRATKRQYGLLTGQEVKAIRSSLGLSQEQAAKLFGGGPVAFSKYENDEVTQSEAMDRLLWIAREHPEIVDSLAKRFNVAINEKLATEVEISRIAFRDELASAIEQLGLAQESLEGFLEVSVASNDEIYRLRSGTRAVSRSWPGAA